MLFRGQVIYTSEHRLSDATAVTRESDTAAGSLQDPYVKLMLNIAD